jgi:hypothetical protein
VEGSGTAIKEKLEACGAEEGELCAAMVISVQGGKVKGSQWTLLGDLGLVEISTHQLDGARGVIVTVDLIDMSKFVFPADTDPRTGANRSEWVEGCTLAVKFVTEDNNVITDKNTLTNTDYFTNGGFSLRVVVVPISMGHVMVWVGAAPGTPDWIKGEAENMGLTGYEANIPTFGVKLLKKSKTTEAKGLMKPMEGDLISKSWGMYPLLQVKSTRKLRILLNVLSF